MAGSSWRLQQANCPGAAHADDIWTRSPNRKLGRRIYPESKQQHTSDVVCVHQFVMWVQWKHLASHVSSVPPSCIALMREVGTPQSVTPARRMPSQLFVDWRDAAESQFLFSPFWPVLMNKAWSSDKESSRHKNIYCCWWNVENAAVLNMKRERCQPLFWSPSSFLAFWWVIRNRSMKSTLYFDILVIRTLKWASLSSWANWVKELT